MIKAFVLFFVLSNNTLSSIDSFDTMLECEAMFKVQAKMMLLKEVPNLRCATRAEYNYGLANQDKVGDRE